MVPGLPTVPFVGIAIVLGLVSFFISEYQKEEAAKQEQVEIEGGEESPREKIESLLPLDMVELEVGYGLINIVESEESGDLLERILSIRKQFAMDFRDYSTEYSY